MNQPRSGTTQVEMVIACVLLSATIASITAYRRHTLAVGQSAHSASLAQSRLLNARQEIGLWPYDDLQSGWLEKLSFDQDPFLPDCRCRAEVSEIEEPIAGKRVTLMLQWQAGELSRTTPSLTFGVSRP